MNRETQPPPYPQQFNQETFEYYNDVAKGIFGALDITPVKLYDETGFTSVAKGIYGPKILDILHGYVIESLANFGVTGDMMNALALQRDRIVEAVKSNKYSNISGVEEFSLTQPLLELEPEKDQPIKPENRSEGSEINGQSGTIFMPERKKNRAVRRSSGEHWSAPPKRKKPPRGYGRARKKRDDPWTTYANVSGSIFSSAAMRPATDTS